MVDTIQKIEFDERGLIPAIVQDTDSKEVIGLFYMDNEGLKSTLNSGMSTFYASPGQEPTIGRFAVTDVRVSKDGGSITVLVASHPGGSGAEHPGRLGASLLHNPLVAEPEVAIVDMGSLDFGIALNDLYCLIAERKEQRPEGSYTTYLFNSGLDKILKKVAEEAGEVIIAAKNRAPGEIISEVSDLLYHLLVMMVERDVKLSDVKAELARRAGGHPQESTPEKSRDKSVETQVKE